MWWAKGSWLAGWWWFWSGPERAGQTRAPSPSLCPPGSRLTFLLAVPVDSFSEGDLWRVDQYLTVLGEEAWGSMVGMFTYGSELKNRSIAQHAAGGSREEATAEVWPPVPCSGQEHRGSHPDHIASGDGGETADRSS